MNSEGKTTGYAFVKYKNPEYAKKLEEQGELNFNESKLTIHKFQQNNKPNENKGTANMYIKNFKQTLSEEDLRNFFK